MDVLAAGGLRARYGGCSSRGGEGEGGGARAWTKHIARKGGVWGRELAANANERKKGWYALCYSSIAVYSSPPNNSAVGWLPFHPCPHRLSSPCQLLWGFMMPWHRSPRCPLGFYLSLSCCGGHCVHSHRYICHSCSEPPHIFITSIFFKGRHYMLPGCHQLITPRPAGAR